MLLSYHADAGGVMLRQTAQSAVPAAPTATATVTAVMSPRSKHAEARMLPPASPGVSAYIKDMGRDVAQLGIYMRICT